MKPGAQPADKPAYFDDPAMQALYQMVLILGEELGGDPGAASRTDRFVRGGRRAHG